MARGCRLTGFSKINNRNRFQKDAWEGELQFDRVYRPSATAVKNRIKYLFPESERGKDLERYLMELEQMLELADQHNIRVVVIKMPMPGQFRAALPNEAAFNQAMAVTLERRGTSFIDLSAELNEPRYYFDTDHLNKVGINELFARHLKAVLVARAN
ncbi:SGNH/GDSL hydrolase family protein [Afipia sp. Root123D2]|uniref:SGNH/GDSL hydrolase family protein n=1 Tax=Afipia sp. Root123D2 TaxID=1736436 RepID=UPI000AB7ADB1|nr:SGNH/GDSL hydrolase family protein [Afipia sp. Root123D2]